jgi:hypothetical protein
VHPGAICQPEGNARDHGLTLKMVHQMENPATLAACGAPETDLAGALISPEYTALKLRLQASRLMRLYAVNAAMAEAIAPLVFLEALQR